MKLYSPVEVTVAGNQREKLRAQIDQKYLPVKIVVKGTTLPIHTLLLTRGQIAKIEKARESGRRRYKTICMSRNQIEKNRNHQGGFLQFIDGNMSMDNVTKLADNGDNGLYLVKHGHTMQVFPIQGNGLHLQEHLLPLREIFTDGLYLKHGNVIETADTVLLDEKKLPVLQWIL